MDVEHDQRGHEITGVEKLATRHGFVEAFAWGINACYIEQEGGGPRYGVSRDDLRYCWSLAEHARLAWQAALHDELRRRWGKPEDIKAAAKLPIHPDLQALLLGDRPQVPLDPSREPHAIPDVPDLSIGTGWSRPLQDFLRGRRELLAELAMRSDAPLFRGPPARVPDQASFIERSQPPEREDDVEPALERFDAAIDALGVIDPRPREPGEDDDVDEPPDPDPQLH